MTVVGREALTHLITKCSNLNDAIALYATLHRGGTEYQFSAANARVCAKYLITTAQNCVRMATNMLDIADKIDAYPHVERLLKEQPDGN